MVLVLKDIAEIRNPRAVEMILSKTFYDAVAVMIARAPIPAFVDVHRSDLNCAKGNAGAEEDMAMTAGADIRIDGCQWASGLADLCG